ncbi:MAG: F0F1 ATP synthase subunit B [Bacilli bacterium]|nr:F0F1 ATP synthase subunit B [Bacilli bacterium]
MKNKGKIILLILLSTFSLTSCDGVPFSSEDFTSRISFNVWDFLATFLAFVVLVLVVFFFGYKPIKEYVRKRGEYVEGKIKTAEERELKSQGLVKEAEENLVESKKSAILIVEKAREDANKQKAEILEQAKQEAKEEKIKAEQEIAQEIESTKDEIHREIVQVAMDASKKVLGREVNSKDNEKLVNDFINDLETK